MSIIDVSFTPPPLPEPKRRGGSMTPNELEAVRMRNLSIASAIRAGGRSQSAIAKAFKVSRATVSLVNRTVVLGLPRERNKAIVAGSPAMMAMEQAEAELKRAQRAVLIAEAKLFEAQAMLRRERAEAFNEEPKT